MHVLVKLLFLLGIGLGSNWALAAEKCNALFAERETKSQPYNVEKLFNFRDRVLKSANVSLESAFNVEIKVSEQETLLQPLIELIQKVKPNLASLSADHKKTVEIYWQEVEKFSSKFKTGKSITYGDVVEASSHLSFSMDLIWRFQHPDNDSFPGLTTLLQKPDAFLSGDESFRSNVVHVLRAGSVPIFTSRDLSIRDFNYSIGDKLAYIGLTDVALRADGGQYTPFMFSHHDFAHAKYDNWGTRDRRRWRAILAKVDSWPDKSRAMAHILIFVHMHELRAYTHHGKDYHPGPGTEIYDQYQNFSRAMLISMDSFFLREGDFGEKSVSKLSKKARRELMVSTAKSLDGLLFEYFPDGLITW